MKIKLLIIPLVIFLVVVIGVWFIYPTYSNGKDGIRDHYVQLKSEQEKLASIRGKSGNVSKLLVQIDSLGSDKDVVTGFVPESMDESMIIKNMSQMAMDSGLSVIGLNIKKSAERVASAKNKPELLASLPEPQSFETDIQVAGDYDGVKNFLIKLGTFSRYNIVSYASIKKYLGQGENPENAVSSNALTADIKIDFYYVDHVKLNDQNVSDNVFSSANLNTDVISLIKEKRSFYPYGLNVEQTGKANPFMP